MADRRHEHSGRGEGRGSTSGARGRSSCKGRGTGRGVGASANDQLTDSQREILVNGWKQHENVLTNNPFQGATPGPSSEGLVYLTSTAHTRAKKVKPLRRFQQIWQFLHLSDSSKQVQPEFDPLYKVDHCWT